MSKLDTNLNKKRLLEVSSEFEVNHHGSLTNQKSYDNWIIEDFFNENQIQRRVAYKETNNNSNSNPRTPNSNEEFKREYDDHEELKRQIDTFVIIEDNEKVKIDEDLRQSLMLTQERIATTKHKKNQSESFTPQKQPLKGPFSMFRQSSPVYSEKDWLDIIQSQKKLDELDKRKLRNSLRKGIPDYLRGHIWKIICNVSVWKQKFSEATYLKLLTTVNEEDDYYIMKDLERTISGYEGFRVDPKTGKNKLYNVLMAYSNLDTEIGYCQGINYLTSLLVLNFDDEEDAFWCLVDLLMGRHDWRRLFDDNTSKLMELLAIIEKELSQKCPKVLDHLQVTTNLNIAASFSSMFITLFIYDLPQQIATRVFEMFLLEGENFLIQFLIKVIKLKQKKIITLTEMKLLKYIRSEMIIECINEMTLDKLLK